MSTSPDSGKDKPLCLDQIAQKQDKTSTMLNVFGGASRVIAKPNWWGGMVGRTLNAIS